jgi:hypothetical protein
MTGSSKWQQGPLVDLQLRRAVGVHDPERQRGSMPASSGMKRVALAVTLCCAFAGCARGPQPPSFEERRQAMYRDCMEHGGSPYDCTIVAEKLVPCAEQVCQTPIGGYTVCRCK